MTCRKPDCSNYKYDTEDFCCGNCQDDFKSLSIYQMYEELAIIERETDEENVQYVRQWNGLKVFLDLRDGEISVDYVRVKMMDLEKE